MPCCSRARPCVLSSEVLCAGHGSVGLTGGGEALLGGSWHWAFGGVPMARILGLKPLPLSFASMRWVDYLTACCLPSGPAIPRLDGNRGKQPQTETSEILNENQPSLRLSWLSQVFSIATDTGCWIRFKKRGWFSLASVDLDAVKRNMLSHLVIIRISSLLLKYQIGIQRS